MKLYIKPKDRLVLYGDEEAVGYMLEEMGLEPEAGTHLSTWMAEENEAAVFMRTEVKDSFYDTPDWRVTRDLDPEEIERVEIELFGSVVSA